MCGRFTLTSTAQVIAEAFALDEVPDLEARTNIAPGSPIAAVRATDTGGRHLAVLRWGLVPSWAKELIPAGRMFNARSETAAEKPAFRSAMRARRCIVPADGFYEWQAVDGRKQPLLFARDDGAPFGIAGLWERWRAPDGRTLDSCTLLTTTPNALIAPVHDRMPVILAPESYALWLDPAMRDPARLAPLLASAPPEGWHAEAVTLAAPPRAKPAEAAPVTSGAPATTTRPRR